LEGDHHVLPLEVVPSSYQREDEEEERHDQTLEAEHHVLQRQVVVDS
jgi:hypothetical protein